ncbi:MAG: hypothetical protein M3P48_01805 [Actinomycetota bacterium]|nr:hypothetical protein [Actinomycetota bacterium]
MCCRLVISLASAAVLLSGCGAGETSDQEVVYAPAAGKPSGERDWSGPAQRVCAEGGGNALIDWVDFRHARRAPLLAHRLANGDGGPPADAAPVGQVRCWLSDMVSDPDYRSQDGDAAFLTVGTRVYRFGKSDPRLRVLVKRENGYRVYEARSVNGDTGSEVLDLRAGRNESPHRPSVDFGSSCG